MYLSQMAVRHQKASSAGMFISRRAAIGAWMTFDYWNVMLVTMIMLVTMLMMIPVPGNILQQG